MNPKPQRIRKKKIKVSRNHWNRPWQRWIFLILVVYIPHLVHRKAKLCVCKKEDLLLNNAIVCLSLFFHFTWLNESFSSTPNPHYTNIHYPVFWINDIQDLVPLSLYFFTIQLFSHHHGLHKSNASHSVSSVLSFYHWWCHDRHPLPACHSSMLYYHQHHYTSLCTVYHQSMYQVVCVVQLWCD